MAAGIVYILCILTSLVCAGLLLRMHFRTGGKLLLWSGLCFVCIGIANVLLFVDMILLPNVNLSALRNGIVLLGVAMLLFGLIWETK